MRIPARGLPALAGLGALVLATAARAGVVSFIPLPPPASPRDLLFNPISNKLYTANTPQTGAPSNESVTIIDGASNTVITTIPVAADPAPFMAVFQGSGDSAKVIAMANTNKPK